MASDGEITCTSDPNFAVIYSFLKVFGSIYGLEVPSITTLQELIENTQEVIEPLKDLHVRLLRRALKSVQSNRWEKSLIKFCHQQAYHQEAWEIERFSYKKASTQVKLKVLKLLLEYQFTCHPKFKSAVNALHCKELRLEPVGKDKNGCVYWLQVDADANLCLYREDQDEETWQLIARNREEFVNVIAKLKTGDAICPTVVTNTNEDSNSTEILPQIEPLKSDIEDDNDEFLSPESESDTDGHKQEEISIKDTDETLTKDIQNVDEKITNDEHEVNIKDSDDISSMEVKELDPNHKSTEDKLVSDNNVTEEITEESQKKLPAQICPEQSLGDKIANENNEIITVKEDLIRIEEKIEKEASTDCNETCEIIEEPVMLITGEGSGADCESSSYIIGEEITESIMYFYGEGNGYDNDTGNPEAIEHTNSSSDNLDDETHDELLNGENTEDIVTTSNSNKSRLSKSVRLKSKILPIAKRALKNQCNDNLDVDKLDTKKHCIRDSEKSNGPDVNTPEYKLKRESSVNEKSTSDGNLDKKNYKKKIKRKAKKKFLLKKSRTKNDEEIDSTVIEKNNIHIEKSSIIEKRKSSISSDQDGNEKDLTDSEKEKTVGQESMKVDDTLPTKKLRLEVTSESNINTVHSKDKADQVTNNDSQNGGIQDKSTSAEDFISKRKKIKAKKGKLKGKKLVKNNLEVNDDKTSKIDDVKKKLKSLKRSLLDSNQSDKGKSESQSESGDDEHLAIVKRQKMKPKKNTKSSRKRVEAKLQEKNTSESDEETLYSLGKKQIKKAVKKKKVAPSEEQKEKSVATVKDKDGGGDTSSVRQSRRIAQLKIREEAQRRHLEEVALRELKMIHKKKNKDEEEEWKATGSGSSSEAGKKRGANARRGGGAGKEWRADDTTGPEPDSDSDEPLFEHAHDEPDLEFGKSDHEFSPESDLESGGEPAEPVKRARTLQAAAAAAAGGAEEACRRCGSGEQPEWILLCDRCDAGYHASCLKPILLLVPHGDWFCPPCSHDMLISSLENELSKYDELLENVQTERAQRQVTAETEENKEQGAVVGEGGGGGSESSSGSSSESGESWTSSSSSSGGGVYRLRTRRHLPVSYRAQEYDRLISSAIKEEYVEPTTSAGNQGRGKDISTIIEAAEEEKLKAEREALGQNPDAEGVREVKRPRKKQRRRVRKLNSLEVPSEDDDDTDEDFKDTGVEPSSSSASSHTPDSDTGDRSSDSLPVRRRHPHRHRHHKKNKKDRGDGETTLEWSSDTERRKQRRRRRDVLPDTDSEASGTRDSRRRRRRGNGTGKKKSKRRWKGSGGGGGARGGDDSLRQYDALGNVVRARVTYGGLSDDDDENDWAPKHRTRQKVINYTEMPNTESEDEMHKSSGKHMPDSSDEFKVDDSELSSGSDSDRAKRLPAPPSGDGDAEPPKLPAHAVALSELISKTVVVPLEKLPEHLTKAKTEELNAHLEAAARAAAAAEAEAEAAEASRARTPRGRGGRGTRGFRMGRGGRGRRSAGGAGAAAGVGGSGPPPDPDDVLARLVGVKIKDPREEGTILTPNQAEKEKKRVEREAKQAEKEAKRVERLQKKEEKEKLKEQRVKEREEKRLARLALQESKRLKKEKQEYQMPTGQPIPIAGFSAQVQAQSHAMRPRFPLPHVSGPGPGPGARPTGYPERHYQHPHQHPHPHSHPPGTAPPPPPPLMQPRLQVRAELRGAMPDERRARAPMRHLRPPPPLHPAHHQHQLHPHLLASRQPHPPRPPPREAGVGGVAAAGAGPGAGAGTLSVAGSPQPFKPVSEEPSVITRMPHMLNPHYRTPMMYPGESGFGAGGGGAGGGPMYPLHPGARPQYPHQYYSHLRALPPPYPPANSGGHTRPAPPFPRLPPPRAPLALGPGPGPGHIPPGDSGEPPVKIKTEVKTEPEYRSPPQSPAPRAPSPSPPAVGPRDEVSRPHLKIKHTDNKDRRPRYPLGPYAPQYQPYGPYAPQEPLPQPRPPPPPPHPHPPQYAPAPAPYADLHRHTLERRMPAPAPAPLAHIRSGSPMTPANGGPPSSPVPLKPSTPAPLESRASPSAETGAGGDASVAAVKLEAPGDGESEEGGGDGVFGGLVSYFSSQHEEELDA